MQGNTISSYGLEYCQSCSKRFQCIFQFHPEGSHITVSLGDLETTPQYLRRHRCLRKLSAFPRNVVRAVTKMVSHKLKDKLIKEVNA